MKRIKAGTAVEIKKVIWSNGRTKEPTIVWARGYKIVGYRRHPVTQALLCQVVATDGLWKGCVMNYHPENVREGKNTWSRNQKDEEDERTS